VTEIVKILGNIDDTNGVKLLQKHVYSKTPDNFANRRARAARRPVYLGIGRCSC
jgi:hypothetical protein